MNEEISNILLGASQMNKPIIERMWLHYSGTQRFFTFINARKVLDFYESNASEYAEKVVEFIYNYLIKRNVPDKEFTNDKNRCSSMGEYPCNVLERPSRYKKIIEKALANKGEKEAHYVVLKALVESYETNIGLCEIPIWSGNYATVGHIDAIELYEGKGNPTIAILDFKPQLPNESFSGQVQLYRYLFAELLDIPLSEIAGGAFNNVQETMIVE